jgi:mevalonate kinase
MDLAYHGEITTPSQCGRMDQCCAFGARPVLMTFDGDRLDCDELTLGGTLHLVIVELAGKKDTTEILQRLNKAYPVADDEAQARLQDLLGATNKRIVRAAMEALSAGDMQRVGALMVEAQDVFDACAMPMCPAQLTSPNLHRVLAHEALKPHIWGGKGVGSQGDGCAQLLCRTADDVETVMRIVEGDLGMSCMPLQIGGAHTVTQALIPAASFSQANFPASASLPPALFPILDTDGLLKPVRAIASTTHALTNALTHRERSDRA